jgi:hypothetical protein
VSKGYLSRASYDSLSRAVSSLSRAEVCRPPLYLAGGEVGTLGELYATPSVGDRLGEFLAVKVAPNRKGGTYFTYAAPVTGRNGKPAYLSLPEYWAFRVSGAHRKFSNKSAAGVHALWGARLLADAGLLRLPDIPVVYSRECSSATLAGLEAIRLLFQAKTLLHGPDPVSMVNRKFLVGWTGGKVEESQARSAIELATKWGVVEKVGEQQCGRHPANVYVWRGGEA